MNISFQNPGLTVSQLLGSEGFEYARSEVDEENVEKEFAEFEI